MIRLYKIYLLLISCVTVAQAQWDGFPLAANTNRSFQELRQAGIDPVQQICAAITERWDVYQWYASHATGGTNEPPPLVYPVMIDVGYTNIYGLTAGWYMTDGLWYGYTEPDAQGRYYVDPYWVHALETNVVWEGLLWEVRIDDHLYTNVWTVVEPVIVTNTIRDVATDGWTGRVTRAIMDTLWDTIATMLPDPQASFDVGTVPVFMDMFQHGSATGYYENAPMYGFTPAGQWYPSNAYYRTLLDVPLKMNRVYPDTTNTFGFSWWVHQPFGRYPSWTPRVHYQRVMTLPETPSLLAEAHFGTNAWSTVLGTSYPALQYTPEYYWFGDTNAPMAHWEYTGTNPPPASVTVSGSAWVQSSQYATNVPFAVPNPGLLLDNQHASYYYPTGLLFTGAAHTSVVETIVFGDASTNLWRSVESIIPDTNAVVTRGDSVRLLWSVHHTPSHRLTGDEFDRMYTALNAMTHTYSAIERVSGQSSRYSYYTNPPPAAWSLSTNVVMTVLGPSTYVRDNDWSYYSVDATLPALPSGMPDLKMLEVFIGYMDEEFSDNWWFQSNGVWVSNLASFYPGWSSPFGHAALGDMKLHSSHTNRPVAINISGDTNRDGTQWIIDRWRFVTEWDFKYKPNISP